MTFGKRPDYRFLVPCVLSILILPVQGQTSDSSTNGSPTVTANDTASDASTTQSTPPSPCDELKQDPNKYLHLYPLYEEGLCFFIVSGSTAHANRKAQAGKNEFSVAAAREVCSSAKATLPIVSGRDVAVGLEMMAVEAEAKKVDGLTDMLGVVLGLEQKASNGTEPYAWDDGTIFNYTAPNWNRNETALFTILSTGIADQWQNFPTSITDQMVAVVCQKTSNQSFPPKMGPCNDPRYEFGAENDHFCYFIVPGAVDAANTNESGGFVFDKKKASDICEKHEATLPILGDFREYSFVRIILGKLQERGEYPAEAVALGISQTIIYYPTVKYSWDGGSDLDFAYQSDWPTKFSVIPSAYTQMEAGTGKWVNKQEKEKQESPVLVLCQRRVKIIRPKVAQNHSRCLWGKTATYPFARTFYTKDCYFHHYAAVQEGDFDVGAAREFCEKESAMLPIIENDEEERWLKNKIQEEENGTEMFSIIPLQLRQVTHIQDYRWGPNQQLKYHKRNWRSKDKYAYFTYLDLNSTNLEWVNAEEPIRNRTIRFLCKQQDVEVASECDRDDRRITKTTDGQTCYFVDERSLNESNTATGNNSYVFNIDKARERCDFHPAKLLAVNNLEEHEFLVRNYKTFLSGQDRGYIILGMKQMHTEKDKTTYFQYEWDDGSEFLFEALWPGKYAETGYVAMYLDFLGENNTIPIVEWRNLQKNQSIDSPVHVVCQQVHRGVRPAPTPSAFQMEDKCGKSAMSRYHDRALREEFGACFFVVSNATAQSNFRIDRDNQTTYAFNMSHARRICQEHGASVITNISSTDEVGVIIDLFLGTFGRHELEGFDSILFAIDLVQGEHPNDYKWWNNSNLSPVPETLKPDEWIDKDAYAFFTTLHFEQKADKQIIVFKNYKNYTVDKPVAVVCRHPAFPQPPPPPTSPHTEITIGSDTPKPTKPAPATTPRDPAAKVTTPSKAPLSMGAPTNLMLIILAAIIDY